MKVCVISSIFTPYVRGGAEVVAEACAHVWKDAEVLVITAAPFAGSRSFAGKWQQEEQLRIFRFTPFNLFTIFNIAKYPALLRLLWHVLDLFNLHTYLVVRRILKEEKPDLILTHNLKGLGYTVPLAIRSTLHALRSMKWLHTIHDMALLHPTGLRIWKQENSWMQKNPLVSLYAWCGKRLFGSPDIGVFPSQFLLDEYRSRGFFQKSKTAVVRNPVMSSWPSTSSGNKVLFPERSSAELKGFRFLYLGQLEPYKGIELLLAVWKEFSATHREVELLIAGTGSLEKEVVRSSKQLSRCHYLGYIAQDKLTELFARVHCTVLPTLAYENSPTVIGESLAFGVPVIASRIGGIPELLKDGVEGLLIIPGARDEFKIAMERMMGSEWVKFSTQAKTRGKQFSLEQYALELKKLVPIE